MGERSQNSWYSGQDRNNQRIGARTSRVKSGLTIGAVFLIRAVSTVIYAITEEVLRQTLLAVTALEAMLAGQAYSLAVGLE